MVSVTNDLDASIRLSLEHSYFSEVMQEIALGWDPTFQSHSMIAYLDETGRGAKADVVTPLHVRLLEAMADPQMHKTYAVPGPVRQDLASLLLHDPAGNFVHVPGFSYVPRPNANRVDDVHGAVHAAGVAGSVPEIPRSESAGSLSSSQGITPPGAVVRTSDSRFEFALGSLRSEETNSGASLLYSAGGAVPATPAVGAAARLDARAASRPVLEDAFRLTNDLGFLSGSQRAGEELSNVPHGLDESYVATDFDTFRRIDDAPADAPDEIGPRTGPPSEWPGGRAGTSSGPEGIGFGQAEVEGASPPGQQAGETAGFGRSEPRRADDFQFSAHERIVQRLMNGEPLLVQDVNLLRDRFHVASSSSRIRRRPQQARAMMELLQWFAYFADARWFPSGRSLRLSNDHWQALELLLSLLDTPGRRS